MLKLRQVLLILPQGKAPQEKQMNLKTTESRQYITLWIKTVKGICLAACIFSLIVCTLVIANYFQLKTVDPLNSPALNSLVEKLELKQEDSSLRDEIRALDLLARKAYFTRQWQIRTGGFLLLSGISIILACLKLISFLERKIPSPSKTPPLHDQRSSAGLARKITIGGGLLLACAALVLAVFTHGALNTDAYTQDSQRKYWPSFRGTDGLGVAGTSAAAIDWDGKTGRGILWKTEIPRPGFNSPIVWDERIFLSGADQDIKEVYCFDKFTGKILWQKPVDNISGSPEKPPEVTEDTGSAAPTMAADGKRVFAIFATGDIICLDFKGKTIWSRNLGVPENPYGHSSSLIVYRDKLLVQYDHKAGAALLALNTGTGNTIWKKERDVSTSWASPVLVDTQKGKAVVLNANPIVASYDIETGRELWRAHIMIGEIAPSPAYADGKVFSLSPYGFLAALNAETGEVIWKAAENLPDVASPLAAGGYVFLAASYGVVTCLDSNSGDVLWTEEFDEGFYSSPVLVGDRVYLMDRNGVMRIFKAAGEYLSLGNPELDESSVACPAFEDNCIYIRGLKHLYCIGSPDA